MAKSNFMERYRARTAGRDKPKPRERAPGELLPGTDQEQLLTTLLFDSNAGRVLASLLEPEDFSIGINKELARAAIEYQRQYKKAPGNNALPDAEKMMRSDTERQAASMLVARAEAFFRGDYYNGQHVVDRVKDYRTRNGLKGLILKAAEKITKPGIPTAEILTPLSTFIRDHQEELPSGLQATDVREVLAKLEAQEQEFYTGIEALDRRHINPARGHVMLWIAPTNLGKSWALVNTGKHALFRTPQKVLHVSLEMSAEEVIQRYWQTFFAASSRPSTGNVIRFERDEANNLIGMQSEELSAKFTLTDSDAEARIKKRDVERTFGNLRIETWPSGMCTTGMLRAHLKKLENDGFKPDLLLLDYIGIMKVSGEKDQLRHQLKAVMVDLRAIASEYNLAVVTAHQANREGAKSANVRATHLSEAYALVQDTDCAITFSQDEATERPHGLARLFVDKNRQGDAKITVGITQSYRTGQFCLDSVPYPGDAIWKEMVEGLGGVTGGKRSTPLPQMTAEHITDIARQLGEGMWREDIQSPEWGGSIIAKVLGITLDLTGKKHCDMLLARLLREDVLETYEAKDKQHKVRTYIRPKPVFDLDNKVSPPLQ